MFIGSGDLSITSSGAIVEELDDKTLDIISVKYLGFTSKKKLEKDNILYYNNKDFNSDYAKYNWMKNKLCEFYKNCEYIAIEQYAYGKSASQGQIFSLAEFEGNIKLNLVEQGKKMRLYSVNSNKKFFTGYGLSDKISMYKAFQTWPENKPSLADLPVVDNGHGVAPTSDIVDRICSL